MWGGRFSKTLDERALRYTTSLPVDRRLYEWDVLGSIAHARMLGRQSIIPSADAATRRIPVEVSVPNEDGRFTAHTLARAVLPLGSPEQAVSVPATALASVGGDHVFTLGEDGQIRRVAVEVIERGPKEAIVKSDQPLTRVVDYPAVDLAEGTRVSVR